MTTCQRRVNVTLALALLAAPVRGQELVQLSAATPQYIDEREGISLDDAIARAVEREPALRAARTEIDVARGQRQQAGLRLNPTVTFEQRDEPGGTDSLTMVGVEWPLDLFRRQGRVQTAERELEARRFAVDDRERLLVAEVRMAYGAAAAAVREVTIADDLVATSRRQLDLVRARVDEGATPPLERDLLDVETRRMEAERVRATGRADVALVQLKLVLGMAPSERLLLQQTLETLVSGTTSADATLSSSATIAPRPDVLEAEARVTLADARIDQARREGRVDVSLFGNYMRMDAGFPQLGFDPAGAVERVRGRFNYVAAGAMVTVPLFDRNQGKVAAAQTQRSGAEARREAAELAALAEVAAAQARAAQAQQAVSLYTGGIRALARQNLDVVRQTFDLGRATVFEVLAEQRRYLDIEQAYTTALREAWEARADLKRALGDPK
jgi:cobalt-zinc-cadmium efflux system outer membrane protein